MIESKNLKVKVRITGGAVEFWKAYRTGSIGLYITKNSENCLLGLTHARSGLGFFIDEFSNLKTAQKFADKLKNINWLLEENELSEDESVREQVRKVYEEIKSHY